MPNCPDDGDRNIGCGSSGGTSASAPGWSSVALSLALKGARAGWWTRNLATNEVLWSPELEAVFGLPPGGFEGTRGAYLDRVLPEDREGIQEVVRKAVADGKDYSVEFRFRKEDGSIGWMEGRGVAAYDPDGTPTFMYGVGIDITERIEAEIERARIAEEIRKSEARYRFMADSMPALVFTSESNGIIEFASRRWEEFFGISIQQIRNWTLLVHKADLRQVMSRIERSLDLGVSFEAECRLKRHDGVLRWHLCRAEPMRDESGTIQRWFGTLTDIHEQRERERLLEALTEILDETRELDTPVEIMEVTTRLACEALGGKQCVYLSWQSGSSGVVVGAHHCYCGGTQSSKSCLGSAETGALLSMTADEAIVIHDVDSDTSCSLPNREVLISLGVKAAVIVPLKKDGIAVASLHLHMAAPRTWSQEDIRFIRVAAERCWGGIQRVIAAQEITRSEARFQELLEAATVGIIVNHRDGVFTFANRPALEMLGYSKEDVRLGRLSWANIQAPDRIETDDRALAQLQATGRCEPYETEFVSKDGRRIPVYVGAAFLPGPSEQDLVGAAFVTDLTGLKKAQQELIALNEELDKRVRIRTSELEDAYRDQESYNYSISHDLRAPLRSIVANARMIEEDHGEGLTEGARRLLKRQIQSANRLAALVDDLLNLSRVGRQEMKFETVDLTAIAHEVAYELNAAERIEIQEGMRALGDGALLRLVWQNLIGNAIKFSSAETAVHVASVIQGSEQVFYVRDFGIGFDMKYAHRLFLPFERLVSEQEFGGTGIGLTNVHKVIQRHHGKIWAESEPGKGATFYFSLPKIGSAFM